MSITDEVPRCSACGIEVPRNLTSYFDRTADGTVYPRHVGCESPPKCPVHRVLLTGGGEYWVCDIDGCAEKVPDSGDHPDNPFYAS